MDGFMWFWVGYFVVFFLVGLLYVLTSGGDSK